MRTLSKLAAHTIVASLALVPMLVDAQTAPSCGVPGTPPCPAPEPGTWPLAGLALAALVAVKFIKRK